MPQKPSDRRHSNDLFWETNLIMPVVVGVITTVIGGLILAFVIEDARFDPNRSTSESAPTTHEAEQPITIPSPTSFPSATRENSSTARESNESCPGEILHVVQAEENIFRIALHYGLTVDEIAKHNKITNPARLDVGQIMRIPPADGCQ